MIINDSKIILNLFLKLIELDHFRQIQILEELKPKGFEVALSWGPFL